MADKDTLSARVSPEMQDLFYGLVEQSPIKTKGEFMEHIIKTYAELEETAKTKENVSMLKPAIVAVETLTSRILEVLNGAGAIITTNEEEHKQKFEEEHEKYLDALRQLDQKHREVDEKIKSLESEKKTAESKSIELQQAIEGLETIISDKDAAISTQTALIDEYKEKNDTLSGIVSEYKIAAEENKNLLETVSNLKRVNESLQRQVDELNKEQQKQMEMNKLEQDNIKNSLLIQKDTALIELKQEYQIKLEQQQSKHTSAISEYENKVRELLEQLQDKQVSKASTQPSRSKKPTSKKSTGEEPATEDQE